MDARRGLEADWFRQSFDALYPLLYRHRDLAEADRFLERLEARGSLRSARILDLGCGPGRYLEALERRGSAAIGLDLSAALLARARARLAHPRLVRGDMRDLPFRAGAFGGVLVMFTTFGYFPGDEENERVLSEIARVLGPGGCLVLDLHNAREARRCLVPRSRREIEELVVEERRWIEPGGRFLRKTTTVQGPGAREERSYEERVRLYEEEEIVTMLRARGFRVLETWGGYDAAIFDPDRSKRLLLLARVEGPEP